MRRLAWTGRTLPAKRDELAQYVIDHKRQDLPLDEPADELVSYFQLLRRAPDVAEDHVLLFSLQIDTFRAAARQAIKRPGGETSEGLRSSPTSWVRLSTCSRPRASPSAVC